MGNWLDKVFPTTLVRLADGAGAEYNGWVNKPTWAVALWIGNTESSYRHVVNLIDTHGVDEAANRLRIEGYAPDIFSSVRFSTVENLLFAGEALGHSVYQIADTMRARVENRAPESHGVIADLMNWVIAWLPYEDWARGHFGTEEQPMPDTYNDLYRTAFSFIDWRAIAESFAER